ncbi:hypothetical protein EPH_0015590 [Eimeria praecox]|uniref:Uncharacterized protein n=1 Tax=Eimeria praecox TaxID=51316 RepID=U6GYN7_9EIME|nr:hypothetical protein EPH_0015590 [Eimeria praecox]
MLFVRNRLEIATKALLLQDRPSGETEEEGAEEAEAEAEEEEGEEEEEEEEKEEERGEGPPSPGNEEHTLDRNTNPKFVVRP